MERGLMLGLSSLPVCARRGCEGSSPPPRSGPGPSMPSLGRFTALRLFGLGATLGLGAAMGAACAASEDAMALADRGSSAAYGTGGGYAAASSGGGEQDASLDIASDREPDAYDSTKPY